MASELGWVGLGVSPDFTGFKGKVDRESSKAMAAAGVTGGTAFGESAGKSAGSKFKSAIKSAAKVAAVGFAAAGAMAIKFGSDALDEAREAQKVGALTTSTIKATGGAAKVTAKHVGDLSAKISERAGIDDEVIQRGANMLLTFKNVRNEAGKGSKIFDRTTQAITDMAASMAGGKGGDIDLKSSSILMGKALNDPVKGLSALTRVGITFTEEQKAINTALIEGGDVNALNAMGYKVTAAEFKDSMEKRKATAEETVRFFTGPLKDSEKKYFDHLAEGGHTLEAQKNILKEVNSQFKGAAEAQATDAEKLQVAWGNFKEEVGTELLPVMDDLARFLTKKGIPKAKEFFGWVKDTGVPAIKDLKDDLKPAARALKDLVGFFDDLPGTAKLAPITGLLGGLGYMKLRGGKGALGAAGSALGVTKPVPVLVTNAGFGAGAGGVSPGATVMGPDGKPTKPVKGSRLKGAGKGLGATLAAISLPWIVDEFGAEYDFARDRLVQGTFHPSTTKLPGQGARVGGGDALAGLLLDPLGTKKIKDSHDAVERLGGAWVATSERVGTSTKKMVTGADKVDGAVGRNKNTMKNYNDVLRNAPETIATRVRLHGVERAHSDISGLMGALDNFATNATNALDAAGNTVLDAAGIERRGRNRRRRRNLGGVND